MDPYTVEGSPVFRRGLAYAPLAPQVFPWLTFTSGAQLWQVVLTSPFVAFLRGIPFSFPTSFSFDIHKLLLGPTHCEFFLSAAVLSSVSFFLKLLHFYAGLISLLEVIPTDENRSAPAYPSKLASASGVNVRSSVDD